MQEHGTPSTVAFVAGDMTIEVGQEHLPPVLLITREGNRDAFRPAGECLRITKAQHRSC
jgi:hypothetical protein